MAHLVSQEELCDEFEMFGDQLDTPEVIEKCKRYSIRKSGEIFSPPLAPEGAVLAKDVNEFKSKIDQHWNHEVMYDY